MYESCTELYRVHRLTVGANIRLASGDKGVTSLTNSTSDRYLAVVISTTSNALIFLPFSTVCRRREPDNLLNE